MTYFIICLAVLTLLVPDVFGSIKGNSISCIVSKVVIVPLYKPLSLAMWGMLMTVLQFGEISLSLRCVLAI